MGFDPLSLAIIGVGAAIAASNQSSARSDQMRAIEEQRRHEEEMAKLTPEEASRYNALVNQLAWMAGMDPSGMFITEGLRGGATVGAPDPMSDPFRVISPETIEAVLGRAQVDTDRMVQNASEKALSDLARRGLAGSSLVDQLQAYIGSRASEKLSDLRAEVEFDAERLQRQFEQQARSMLMGLNPERTADHSLAFQALQQQLAAEQAGWGSMLGGMVGWGLDTLLPGGLGTRLSTNTVDPYEDPDRWRLQTPSIRW